MDWEEAEWTVNDVRLIDADKFEAVLDNVFDHLYENGKPDLAGTLAAFVNMLTKQPTIDAVPVVRCKNCVYYYDGGVIRTCFHAGGLVEVEPDGFCSHGERKDGEP